LLIIHFKRFENNGRKINSSVEFPASFSLAPYTSAAVDYNVKKKILLSK